MGKINFLLGGYEGKTAQTYGVYKKGGYIIKAVPFSHAPHNARQDKAVKAFTRLNRLSSNIAKNFFEYLNLSAKKMYKNNAVAQWLKPCIENGNFDVLNISKIIPEDKSLEFQNLSYVLGGLSYTIKLKNHPEKEKVTDEPIYIAVVDNNGKVHFGLVAYGEDIEASYSFDFINFAYFRVIAFKSVLRGRKNEIKGFCYSEQVPLIIINEVYYINRKLWEKMPTIADEIIYFSGQDASLNNEILYTPTI